MPPRRQSSSAVPRRKSPLSAGTGRRRAVEALAAINVAATPVPNPPCSSRHSRLQRTFWTCERGIVWQYGSVVNACKWEAMTEIYLRRGLDRALATTVAEQLMATDPLGSHLRDELGLQPDGLARPLQAAVVSAVSFAVGAVLPLALIVLAPIGVRVPVTALAALVLLPLLGAVGARLGGAPAGRAALRVIVGGA